MGNSEDAIRKLGHDGRQGSLSLGMRVSRHLNQIRREVLFKVDKGGNEEAHRAMETSRWSSLGSMSNMAGGGWDTRRQGWISRWSQITKSFDSLVRR